MYLILKNYKNDSEYGNKEIKAIFTLINSVTYMTVNVMLLEWGLFK